MRSQQTDVQNWAATLHREMSRFGLRGQRTVCPVCGERGTAATRWVTGSALKPLHVIHSRNGTVKRVCSVPTQSSRQIREEATVGASDLRKVLQRAKCFVLASGGNDSIALLSYLRDVANGNVADLTVVHVDTTVGIPEVTEYVKTVCSKLGMALSIVRPAKDYFQLVRECGIPSFRSRWCCRELKIVPVAEFLAREEGPKVVLDGIRAEESNVRANYLPIWLHPSFRCLSVSPLFRWSKAKVLEAVDKSGLPEGPAKVLGCSAECWCGAYKRRKHFLQLRELNPGLFEKLASLEEENLRGFTFIYENGRRTPLRELGPDRDPR